MLNVVSSVQQEHPAPPGIETDVDQPRRGAQLEQADDHLGDILSSMADIILAMDREGRFTYYHAPEPGLLYLLPGTFLGRKVVDVMPRSVAVPFGQAFERAQSGETTEFEYELSMDGQPRWYAAKLSPLIDAQGFAGCVVVAREMTERLREHEALKDVQELLEQQVNQRTRALQMANQRLQDEIRERRRMEEQLQQLAREVVSAQELERRRLSQTLHDEAGQALTTLRISLELLQEDLPLDCTGAQLRLARAIGIVDEISQLVRSLARNLRPPALDHVGLAPTLEAFCEEFARRTQLSLSFRASRVPLLSEPAMICLYRCLQEALTNVARHANASWVRVELQHDSTGTCLTVEDDGQGFDVQSSCHGWPWGTGVGLLGMRERLESLGGQLEINSWPGHGTCLVARIPYDPQPAGEGHDDPGSHCR